MRGRITVLSVAAAMIWASPVPGQASKAPDKAIALVHAEGCQLARLTPALDRLAHRMAEDRRTSRVVLDWPADPERNLDLLGRPSPFLAGLEVNAAIGAVEALARQMAHHIGRTCPVDVYLVREKRLLTLTRSWKTGEPSPGIKLLTTLVRKPGTSHDSFVSEWTGPHAALALSWREGRADKDGRYVQNRVVGSIGPGVPSIDGIGEGEGPGQPSPGEREARMKAAAHSAGFMDVAATRMFLSRETIVKD